MGKVIFSKKFGHTNFCLSSTPIGGYVEIATEEGIKGTKGFNQIPYYQKFLIMLGGIFCNFLLTYLIFAGLLFTGMPESGLPYEVNTTTVAQIPKNSLNKNTLQAKDRIVAVNNVNINNDASIIKKEALQALKINKKDLAVTINRQNSNHKILLNLNPNQNTLSKLIDISFEKKDPLTITASLVKAYELTTFCLNSIIQALKQLFSSSPNKGFVGPIMAVAVSSKSAQKGLSHLLLLLAIISVNLGLMNLLPLPIFDGGQFVIFTIEAITRKRLSERIQNLIGTSSWILAIGLLVIFSLQDLYTLIFG
tara:strand:+ start:367 stop:1290 length:924 start_codon:yes stop_codon:yes gene_type:complete